MRLKQKSRLLPAAVFVFACLALSLVPMLLLAAYDHPCADDFSYGVQAAQAWRTGGSVFSAAAGVVRGNYFTWQGSFSGVFLMALQPAVFGERVYVLAPLLILALFLSGTLFLAKAFLRDLLGADRCSFLIIGCGAAAMSLNFLPSAVEGIYWYNGAVYYTGFYSVLLVVCALLLRQEKVGSRRAAAAVLAACAVLSFFLGGSNYTTALTSVLVPGALAVPAFLRKKRRGAVSAGVSALAALAGLSVSAAAPGNSVRKSDFVNTPSAPQAVLDALRAALHFLGRWTAPQVAVCLVFLLPLVWRIVRKTEFRLPHPLWAFAVSFGLFAAQFAPPYYALGQSGPGRLLDAVYYSYYLFLLFNLFCLTAWVGAKLRGGRLREKEEGLYRFVSGFAKKHAVLPCACFALLFAAGYAVGGHAQPVTGVSAADSLRSGQAAEYGAEAFAREAAYRSGKGGAVTVRAFTEKPYDLYFNDIETSPSNWRNEAVAKYYGLKSVVRRP